MALGLLLLIGIPFFVALVIWGLYNALIKLRNQCREAWSNVDAELKRRYDLIPNLVETVKGYARHEREVLEQVTRLRSAALASNGAPASQAVEENKLVTALRQLFAVVERYPDLKANQNFLDLQRELANTEDRIQAARRFYNANVRDYNTRIEQFPSNLLARSFDFQPEDFFEIEAVQAAPPRVAVP